MKPVVRLTDPSGNSFDEFDFLDGTILTDGTYVVAKFNKEPEFVGIVRIINRTIDYTPNGPRYYCASVDIPNHASVYLWGVGMVVRRIPKPPEPRIERFDVWAKLMEDND